MAGCSDRPSARDTEVQDFLRMYGDVFQRMDAAAKEAEWQAAVDGTEENIGQSIGARRAMAAFSGSRYVIENSRRFLRLKDSLTNIEFRQLDKILLNAAESPATIPDIVQARIRSEAHLGSALDSLPVCLQRSGGKCLKPLTFEEVAQKLLVSRELTERRRIWEAAHEGDLGLKKGLAEVRDLRNRVARELGYSSYFHLRIADYGVTVPQMMQLMDKMLVETEDLYRKLHLYARARLAQRYSQPMPEQIPVHWLPSLWGQSWPGLAESSDMDGELKARSREWIVRQAERFYTSIGFDELPRSYWEKSDLYALPAGSTRAKEAGASTWHIDGDKDVRTLMHVSPSFAWFEASHRELGRAYYLLACSRDDIPVVLREGASRAFYEAVGELAAIAARQEPYLRQVGLLKTGRQMDQNEWLLSQALDSAVVMLPWSAGVATHFEYDLYEGKLPVDKFNQRWWALAGRYQAIRPPSPRGEEYCDACLVEEFVKNPARDCDRALASLIAYQLHDYIARKILKQDPHDCNYYGNKQVGAWLWGALSLGATKDWRQVIREKTGEDLSSRALLDYFRPLLNYQERTNAAGR
jgi:peptidyl-dipeptidase A